MDLPNGSIMGVEDAVSISSRSMGHSGAGGSNPRPHPNVSAPEVKRGDPSLAERRHTAYVAIIAEERKGPMSDWPSEIRLSPDKRTLTVSFEDGKRFELSAEYLRVMSPSAEVQGHSAAERKTVGGKANVSIMAIHPVGNYAVRL